MKKICFFSCQKFGITRFTNSLFQNATVGSWVYSEPNFVMLWRVWLSQYWIYLPYPPKPRMSEFVFSPIITRFYCYKTPVLWQPDTSQHHKTGFRINPRPYCGILKQRISQTCDTFYVVGSRQIYRYSFPLLITSASSAICWKKNRNKKREAYKKYS